MTGLFANPKALLILLCLGGITVGLFMSSLGVLRGDKAMMEAASKWSKALSGGQEGQRQHNAQVEELHRRVEELKAHTPPDPPHD